MEEYTQVSNKGMSKLYPITVGTMNLALTLPRYKDSRSAINLLVTLSSLNSCWTKDMKIRSSGLRKDGDGQAEAKADGQSSGSTDQKARLSNLLTLP